MESFYRCLSFLMMLVFLVAKASGQNPKGYCWRWNEVYTTCGTPCPRTCENYKGNFGCAQVCVEGCFCRKGYVRDAYGNCILPQQCPQTGGTCWGQNEEYIECKIECPRTCENYNRDIACPEECVPGCYCKQGYVRDTYGNCILSSQCPPQAQCLSNEEYSECGYWCEPSCQNKGPIACPAICVSGCVCKKGFVRIIDAVSGVKAPCIRKDMCPFYI